MKTTFVVNKVMYRPSERYGISMATQLREFLELPYGQLEELNLEAKAQRMARKSLAAIGT